MKAMLDFFKRTARAAAERLKALWVRLQGKSAEVAARVTAIAKNIWSRHKTLIVWTVAWIAFGALMTLGLAGVYYTSPPARLWLEQLALSAGKLVVMPVLWLRGWIFTARAAAPISTGAVATATAMPSSAPPVVPTVTTPPSPPPAAPHVRPGMRGPFPVPGLGAAAA